MGPGLTKGGGFGGCAVALVAADQVESFQEAVVREYQEKTGLLAKVYLSLAADGTGFEVLTK